MTSEVFVSFRGDTRNNFTDHLFGALRRKAIRFFKDDKLEKGKRILHKLQQAIEGSRILVVVFSEEYASSKWCLRELVKIAHYIDISGKHVLPVFYNVDPSEVRNQSGNYKKAFDEYEERFKDDKEMMKEVQTWKVALTQVANLSGWDIRNKPQDAEIEKIVRDIIKILGHYQIDVEVPSYINAAFRSSRTNEAYLFMKNKCVLLNYAPGTTDDRIVHGPHLIYDSFNSLIDTPFGEQGIDCAFDTDHNEAIIFAGNLCAVIDYAPGTTDDKILLGPMTIADMFPFFKGTVFENGIDAAFRSTISKEAYLFRGDQYACINYGLKNLVNIHNISATFPSLRGTIFASGMDAAFASHIKDEAYLFKGENYARINFAPGTTNDYIIGGVKPILSYWPSLRGILPLKNRGLDFHDHHGHVQPYSN